MRAEGQPATSLPDPDPGLLGSIASGWPPSVPPDERGYRAVCLDELRPRAALPLGESAAVVVVSRADGGCAALPCIGGRAGWRVAQPGDGVAAALLEHLHDAPLDTVPARPGFRRERYAAVPLPRAVERSLGTDQTNHSVVVGDAAIVKWRTAFDADGIRSTTLRRHLRQTGFSEAPPLLGGLSWLGPAGVTMLADVDAYLPAATDGWDLFIDVLRGDLLADGATGHALDLVGDLAAVTARLHVALARSSGLIPAPRDVAGEADIGTWRAAAVAAVEQACAIEAADRADLVARAAAVRSAIGRLADLQRTPVQPVHGDLHLGQVVGGSGGLVVIDFDGPPGRHPAGAVDRQPAARDVAQLLCSLDHLAAAVDQRTEGRATAAAWAWADMAREHFLACYRTALADAGDEDLLDQRLLAPFMAEQLCRELIYAAETLPRWRYAPMAALRHRYQEGNP